MAVVKQEWQKFLDCYCEAWAIGRRPLGLLFNRYNNALVVTKLDGASIIRECDSLESLYRLCKSQYAAGMRMKIMYCCCCCFSLDFSHCHRRWNCLCEQLFSNHCASR
jgi:hypothetical protein